jgi:hypothetical protein
MKRNCLHGQVGANMKSVFNQMHFALVALMAQMLLTKCIKCNKCHKCKVQTSFKTIKMEKEIQLKFHLFVGDVLKNTDQLTATESILGMVDTLIQDDKLDDLQMVIRLHFPDYFTDYKPFII